MGVILEVCGKFYKNMKWFILEEYSKGKNMRKIVYKIYYCNKVLVEMYRVLCCVN